MARKKKTKQNKSSHNFSIDLTSLILILIGVIGFGFGPVGMYLKKGAMFLLGEGWMLLLIWFICTGLYMIIKRKIPYFFTAKLIGIYLLIFVILSAGHLVFLKSETTVSGIIQMTNNNCMARMKTFDASNSLTSLGDSSIIIGGGMVGALGISLLSNLFSATGAKIVLIVLGIFATVLIFNVNIAQLFEKLFGGLKDIPKDDGKSEENKKKHLIINEDGIVYDNNDNKDAKLEQTLTLASEVEAIKETEKEKEEIKPTIIHSIDEIKNLRNNNNEAETVPVEEKKETVIIDNYSGDYKLPPLTLLDPVKVKHDNNMVEEVKQNKEVLQRVLKDFGIDANVVEIHIGPAVTEYEITVPAGTKVSRILGINKEIALALGAKDVRIQAPIPGKKAIGIELPNSTIAAVQIKEIFDASKNLKTAGKIQVCLGKNIMGEAINADIAKMPHLLVAGSTGSGKSVCINSMICSILMRYKPNEVKLVLVDPKKVELSNYNMVPHLLCPVVTNPKKASVTLQKIVEEMERRYQLFAEKEFKNITGYNEWVDKYNKENPDNEISKMSYIVVIIDELADLMMVASKEVEESITRITQMARAAGIHLIVATQRPSTDVITGLVKNNIPSRISFAVSSQIDSRTILDQAGAEKLLGRGDMLYFPMGESAPVRVQGCYISDDEIERLIEYCKNQATAQYDKTFEQIQEMPDNAVSGEGFAGDDNSDDAMYDEVLEFAIQTGKISTSLIQRRFRFGYTRAARMMDLLEQRGIVGPQNGSKPREVLIKVEENSEEV